MDPGPIGLLMTWNQTTKLCGLALIVSLMAPGDVADKIGRVASTLDG
ncbi:MAG: hypothetical protein QGF59_26595 [Pirellulaceae bacterium]|nr:hypothetical protein [Pirellulaceae bacterium]